MSCVTFSTFLLGKKGQKPVDHNCMDYTNPMDLVPFGTDLEALEIVN